LDCSLILNNNTCFNNAFLTNYEIKKKKFLNEIMLNIGFTILTPRTLIKNKNILPCYETIIITKLTDEKNLNKLKKPVLLQFCKGAKIPTKRNIVKSQLVILILEYLSNYSQKMD
jgi:hypothetical protein